jgi:hypothetical protein
MAASSGFVAVTGRHAAAGDANDIGAIMEDEHTPEKREVKQPTEARQGEVSKGKPMWWVLVISTVTAALVLLIIYLLFVRA